MQMTDDEVDSTLFLFGDEDNAGKLYDIGFLSANLSEQTLKAELDAEAIHKIMCELENSVLYCVPDANVSATSSSSSSSKDKSFPLTDRLRHLIEAPLRKIRCINASNLKGIQRIIEDICLEDCSVKFLALKDPLIGRHHYLELFLSLLRMCPDYLLKHKKTVYNQKLNVISVFTVATGTKQYSDRSEYMVNFLRFGEKDKTTAVENEKFITAYDTIERNGGRAIFTTHTVQNWVLNEDRTKVCRIVVIPKFVSIVADDVHASTEPMLLHNITAGSVYGVPNYAKSTKVTMTSSSSSSSSSKAMVTNSIVSSSRISTNVLSSDDVVKTTTASSATDDCVGVVDVPRLNFSESGTDINSLTQVKFYAHKKQQQQLPDSGKRRKHS